MNLHLLKTISYFPLLGLQGIQHYWKHTFSSSLTQMDVYLMVDGKTFYIFGTFPLNCYFFSMFAPLPTSSIGSPEVLAST